MAPPGNGHASSMSDNPETIAWIIRTIEQEQTNAKEQIALMSRVQTQQEETFRRLEDGNRRMDAQDVTLGAISRSVNEIKVAMVVPEMISTWVKGGVVTLIGTFLLALWTIVTRG